MKENPKQGALFPKKAVSPGYKKAMAARDKMRPAEGPPKPEGFQTKTLWYYRDRRGS